MKLQLAIIIALLLGMSACTTEDYYRSANLSPALTASVDLDKVDTIKTSAASNLRTFTMNVSATDKNMNMSMLLVNASTGSVKIDGVTANSLAIETSKERGEFTHGIEFTPNNDGLHTITTRVTDDFGNFNSLEKRVYSFTNMPPQLGMSHTVSRYDPYSVTYLFDFTTSSDHDAQWGGAIDSMFVIIKSIPYIEATGDEDGGTIPIRHSVADAYPSGSKEDKYVLKSFQLDDGIDWYTDVWVWVKDNEGAVSDTVHFNIGHVE